MLGYFNIVWQSMTAWTLKLTEHLAIIILKVPLVERKCQPGLSHKRVSTVSKMVLSIIRLKHCLKSKFLVCLSENEAVQVEKKCFADLT